MVEQTDLQKVDKLILQKGVEYDAATQKYAGNEDLRAKAQQKIVVEQKVLIESRGKILEGASFTDAFGIARAQSFAAQEKAEEAKSKRQMRIGQARLRGEVPVFGAGQKVVGFEKPITEIPPIPPELKDVISKDYQTKPPGQWTTADIISQSYYKQKKLPVSVGAGVKRQVPKTIQVQQQQVSPSEVREQQFQIKQQAGQDFLLGGGTEVRSDIGKGGFPVYSPETIYSGQVSTFVPRGTSKQIPVTQTYYVGKDYATRLATGKETEQLSDYIKSEGYKETALSEIPSLHRGARLSLPVTKQITRAYKGGGGGVFGVARVGVVGTDILGSKIIEPVFEKFSIPKGPTISTKPVEEAAVFTFFLGPTSATTAQTERQLFEVSRVKLIGATQQVSSRKAISQAGFEVSRAGKTVKGVVDVTSISKTIPSRVELLTDAGKISLTKENNVIVSFIKGKLFRRGISFPSGKEVVKTGKGFEGVDVAKVVQSNNLFLSKSAGVTKSTAIGGEKLTYQSIGVSKRINDYLIQQGVTSTDDSISASVGLFKILKGKGTTGSFRVTQPSTITGVDIQSILKSANTNALKSSIKSSVVIPPTAPINLYPPLPSVITTPKRKPITPSITSVKTTLPSQYSGTNLYELSEDSGGLLSPGQIGITNLNQLTSLTSRTTPSFKSGQGIKQVYSQGGLEKQKQQGQQVSSLKQLEKLNQQVRQIGALKLSDKLLTRQKQVPVLRQRQVQRYPRIPTIPTISITPPPPLPPPFKLKPVKYPKQSTKGFEVLGRRFGKWKPIGVGKTSGKAIGIGKQWARKTLGASFKVPKFKGTRVKGFLSKKEKEGYVFIEPKKKRIKKGTKEIPELQYWKKVKSPIKKKKLKGGKK